MATICLQCGEKGWDNAFVYCIECLEVGVHRYCLDQIPETLDEFVEWFCDFCKEEEPNQFTILKESSIPAHKMNNPSPKNAKPVEVPVWSGEFSIMKKSQASFNIFVAHLSNKASPKVCEETTSLEPLLQFEKLAKPNVWPRGFDTLELIDESIDLYFFPANSRSCDDRWSYKMDGRNKSQNGPRDATIGFLDTAKSTGFREDKKKSWNGPTLDDVAGSLESPKATSWEDKKKSWNGPTWHGVAGSSKSPNATGWEDKKKSWNGTSWDDEAGSLESLKATGWTYSSIGSMNSLDPTTANMQTDDRWARISENERKARAASGWIEKAAKKEKFLTSYQQNGNERSCDDRCCYNMDDKTKSWNCQWDATASFLDTSKSMGQGEDKKQSWSDPTWDDVACPLECVKANRWEDKKKSWNDPTWGDVAGSLERPKVTGWADNSIRSMNSLDPTTADMQTDDILACSLENGRKARDAEVNKWEKKAIANPEVNGRNEIVAEVNSNTDELGNKYKKKQNKNHLGSMNAHGKVEESNGIKDENVLLLLKSALVEFITEILKPVCKEGLMSKENHNIIVKKVVNKVTSSIRGVYVPKTAAHVDEYMSFSKLKIFNLVNEYVKIFRKRELIA